MSYSAIVWKVVSFAVSQINANEAKQILDESFSQISRVYQNIETGYRLSASHSLAAASKKRNKEDVRNDIREAIGNLKAAYYICKQALDEEVTKGIFLWKKKEFLIKDDRKKFYESLLRICVIATALSDYINDEVNKQLWIEESTSFYKSYLNLYFAIEVNELERINSSFVGIRIVEDSEERDNDMKYDGGSFTYPEKYSKAEKYITKAGQEYIEREKDRLLSEYRAMLKNIKYANNLPYKNC